LPRFEVNDEEIQNFLGLLNTYSTSISKITGKIDLQKMYENGQGDAVRSTEPRNFFSDKNLSGLGLKKETIKENGIEIMIVKDTQGLNKMEYKITDDFEWKKQFVSLLKMVNYRYYELDEVKRQYLEEYGDLYNYAHQVSQLIALKVTPKQAIIVLNGERQYRRQDKKEQKLLKKTLSHGDSGLPNTYDKFLPSTGIYRGGLNNALYPQEQKRFFSQTAIKGRVLHPGGGTIACNSAIAFDSTFIIDPLYNGTSSKGFRGTYQKYISTFGHGVFRNFEAVCSDACGYMYSLQDLVGDSKNTTWMKSMHPEVTNDISASILQDLFDAGFQKDKSRGIKRILLKCALEENFDRNKIFNKFTFKIMSKQRASNLEVILDCFDKRYVKGGRSLHEIMQFVASVVYIGNLVRRTHSDARTGPAKLYDMDDPYYNAYFIRRKEDMNLSDFDPPDYLDNVRNIKVTLEDESEDFYPLGDDFEFLEFEKEMQLYYNKEDLMN
jgi:hypothetical protein